MDDLEEFPEDWDTALAVVAHPDDMEYGASGAVARWTAQGKKVVYLLACRGEAGIDGMAPEEAGPLREREQWAACEAVGVSELEFLDHPDGVMEYGLPLRRDIAAAIRRHRPQLVITGNYHEKFPGGFLNQADHIAVGRATVDGVRDAGNRWVFRDLGLEPWNGVKYLAISGSPDAGHGVDITDTFDKAVQSLNAHEQYLAGLGENGMADPDAFLRPYAEMAGKRFGVALATSFELFRM